MNIEGTRYAEKPWMGLWQHKSEILNRDIPDILSMFQHHVRKTPSAIAIRYFDRTIDYAELNRISDSFAVWLLRRGLAANDRIFIVLQNVPEFVIVALAAWKARLIPVLGNPMYRAPELAKLFADCGPRAILCHRVHYSEINAAAPQGTLVVTVSQKSFQNRFDDRVFAPEPEKPKSTFDVMEAIASVEGESLSIASAFRAEDVGLLLYTSGTTGVPKGAIITHGNLAFVSSLSREWFEIDASSRILAIAPLFHITGFTLHICLALSSGGSMVLLYRFNPQVTLDALMEHRPTFTIGASTVFVALMNAPGASRDHMASFRWIFSGGAPIPPALVSQFQERMGQRIHSSFGMTETTAPTHLAPTGSDIPVDPQYGALSIGVPVYGVEAAIVDEDRNPCPTGVSGEIVVRGPQVMAGYWNRPAETAEVLVDGWMHTGDVGLMDEDGWFYLIDRKKDMINASGFKVWPREVEDALYRHPAVREAAVIGVPDPYRGETVKAFVSLKGDAATSAEELISFTRNNLATYKCPRSIEIIAELPKTASGKIMRQALRPKLGDSDTDRPLEDN